MITKQIQKFNPATMSNPLHYAFNEEVLQFIKKNSELLEKIETATPNFIQNVATQKALLNISKKSFKTDEIILADKERGALYLGIKNAISAYQAVKTEAIQQAYKILWQLVKEYDINPKMQLDKETALLDKFIEDLEKKHTHQVNLLSLHAILTPLKLANNKVRILISERDSQQAPPKAGAMRDIRKQLIQEYQRIVQIINAHAVIDDALAYGEVIDQINNVITRYKHRVLSPVKGKEMPMNEISE